jgi:glycosyltransferase involved in cell wall biosynthesis
MMPDSPLVTVAVPSYNQGRYIEGALQSIFQQDVPVEVFVADGGSADNSLEIIGKWAPKLSGWRSHPDSGQAAAINECIAKGTAPYVCWLNSDDAWLPGGLKTLLKALKDSPSCPVAYGRAWNLEEKSGEKTPVWVEPFNVDRLAFRCIICQPATLIRRPAWEAVGGLDESLKMVMDYDLWWRLFLMFGRFCEVSEYVAVNRDHNQTKTKLNRKLKHKEAIIIIRKHYGCVPLKWWLAQPYTIWFKSVFR